MPRRAMVLLLLMAWPAAPGGAAARAKATTAPTGPAATDTTAKPAAAATSAGAAKPARAKANAPPAAEHAARGSIAAPRRLEDIHIEGEIPAPQVLFITTRDQRRFMSFQHRRYLSTAQQLGEATVLPSDIVVTRAATTPERSHSDE